MTKILNVNELRDELLNNEMNFTELDNFMEDSGYNTVFNDGAIDDIRASENLVYTDIDYNTEVLINFEVISDNEENKYKFVLKVTGVEEF